MASSLGEALRYVPSLTLQHVFRAGGGGNDELDYSVLSVAVATLGLILCVELFRHNLDHRAIGKPFFKTVLEGMYGERKFIVAYEAFISPLSPCFFVSSDYPYLCLLYSSRSFGLYFLRSLKFAIFRAISSKENI